MHIMAAFTVLFGTDSSCLQVRDLKGFFLSAEALLVSEESTFGARV